MAACASKVLASLASRATCRATVSARLLAVSLLVVPLAGVLVTDRTSLSVFFASVVVVGVVVVAAVVDCVDVDVITAVVALEVPPDTTLVTLVTEVGLVVDVVVDVVAILMGSVLGTVVVTVSVATIVVVVVVLNNCFLA